MVRGEIVENDLVSIITPAYNSEATIEETIKSVIYQSYKSWEMIIVNDFSTDNTASIVRRYSEKDERIRLIELDVNSGVASARNIGIRKARGRYIAFLDSNDLWSFDKLLRQISFMEEIGCFFSYTAYEIIDLDGRKLDKIVAAPPTQGYRDLLKKNTIGCLTVMIDAKEIGDIEMPQMEHEDFALWLTILGRGYVAFGLNENLAQYRKLDNSLSFNKFKTVGWVWKIYRENQKIGFAPSAVYLVHFVVRSLVKYKQLGLLGDVISVKSNCT